MTFEPRTYSQDVGSTVTLLQPSPSLSATRWLAAKVKASRSGQKLLCKASSSRSNDHTRRVCLVAVQCECGASGGRVAEGRSAFSIAHNRLTGCREGCELIFAKSPGDFLRAPRLAVQDAGLGPPPSFSGGLWRNAVAPPDRPIQVADAESTVPRAHQMARRE